jgi:hypothetical protein
MSLVLFVGVARCTLHDASPGPDGSTLGIESVGSLCPLLLTRTHCGEAKAESRVYSKAACTVVLIMTVRLDVIAAAVQR